MSNFEIIDAGNGKFVKAWKKGVKFEDAVVQQLKDMAQLPFVFKYVAAMADAHYGMGGPVGGVIPTKGAVCPATCGVDIGCGMMATRLALKRSDLINLPELRHAIETAVPAGRTNNGGKGDRGAWFNVPEHIQKHWDENFAEDYNALCEVYPGARAHNTVAHLGTLGTGNHFIELSEDEAGDVWVVLHSGSRGMGNKIGSYFTDVAKKLCEKWFIDLPNKDLAYLPQDSAEFKAYKNAVKLAQRFALDNRQFMMDAVLATVRGHVRDYINDDVETFEEIQCHHNYISWENHFGENVMITRKGAVRARTGDLGIIPGSMGAKSYIVRGLGSTDSFHSCSHGAGRAMSRTQAVKQFTVADHIVATEGVECIKDISVLDETPAAYKNIESVMAAQSDLVEIVHTLKQFLNVKGVS